jgi:uncharacterized protein YceK
VGDYVVERINKVKSYIVNVSLRVKLMKKRRVLGVSANLHILLSMVILTGCSSLEIHTSDWGHPYLGTEFAVKELPCSLGLSGMAFFIPAPFVLADIPATFLLDTLLLPADVVVSPSRSSDDVIKDKQSHGSCG